MNTIICKCVCMRMSGCVCMRMSGGVCVSVCVCVQECVCVFVCMRMSFICKYVRIFRFDKEKFGRLLRRMPTRHYFL